MCVAWTDDLVLGVPPVILIEVPIVDVPLKVVRVPVDIHGEDSVP